MKLIGMIADHPTPKTSLGGVAFTLNSRDYKGVMIVVLQSDDIEPLGFSGQPNCGQQWDLPNT